MKGLVFLSLPVVGAFYRQKILQNNKPEDDSGNHRSGFSMNVNSEKNFLFGQFWWQCGHGSVLGAYVCTDLHGGAMGFSHGFTVEDGTDERTRE